MLTGLIGKIDPHRTFDSSKAVYTVHRGARYKVYATINVSQTLTHHISDTRAGSRFLSSAQEQEALRGVRADRDAGRRTSRLQHGIDRGEALLQRRRAQDEPGQRLGGPSGAAPYESLPPDLETGNTRTLARLLLCECDLDSRTRNDIARATGEVAMDEEHARERDRVFRR